MKKTVFVFVTVLLLNCSKENPKHVLCNTKNPFEMEWMTEWIADLQKCACTISIFQANYNEETVFWRLMTDPLCQGVIENIIIHSCKGEEMLVLKNYNELVAFQDKVTDMKIIYQCPTP